MELISFFLLLLLLMMIDWYYIMVVSLVAFSWQDVYDMRRLLVVNFPNCHCMVFKSRFNQSPHCLLQVFNKQSLVLQCLFVGRYQFLSRKVNATVFDSLEVRMERINQQLVTMTSTQQKYVQYL